MAKLEKVLRTQNPSKICKCEKLEKWKYLVAILSADLEWSDLDGSGISWWDDRGINHLFIQQCPHNLPMHLHWAGKQFSPYPAITISLFCSWGYPWQRNISNQMMNWKKCLVIWRLMERVWIIGRYWKVPRNSVISEVISAPLAQFSWFGLVTSPPCQDQYSPE